MKIREELKRLLQKYVINNILYKILAIVFAFTLWLVILNITDPEYSRTFNNITVKVENEQLVLDGTHVYTITSGETTSITVTGKRSIISGLTANDFAVTANFAELSITNAAPITAELTGTKSRYASQISIVAKDTSMIISLEEMKSKQIPVEIQYFGEPIDGMVVDEANLSPKKVTISAAESVVDSAEQAIVTANYADIADNSILELEPVVYGENGNIIKLTGDTTLDTEYIDVEFKVTYEKQVAIKLEASGTPKAGYELSGIELSQDTITLKGEKEVIVGLDSIIIDGSAVDISDKDADFDVEVDVTPFLPEGVTVYGESPTLTAAVKISKAETASK